MLDRGSTRPSESRVRLWGGEVPLSIDSTDPALREPDDGLALTYRGARKFAGKYGG